MWCLSRSDEHRRWEVDRCESREKALSCFIMNTARVKGNGRS